MRLATWNLERLSSRPRRERVARWLTEVDADVWVLTETLPGFAPDSGFACVAASTPDEPERQDETWSAIWSRFPMEPLAPTSDPARSVSALVHPPSARPLLVYATVLPWAGSPWRGIRGTAAASFLAALEVQAADWRDLARRFPDADLCVVGDLNQDLADRHYYGSNAGRAKLQEALTGAGLRALTAHPNDPVRRLAADRASVDHICVPAAADRWNSAALGVWPQLTAPDPLLSDHFGVAVTLPSRRT